MCQEPRADKVSRADTVSGTDIGHIGRRKPFSVPDTLSIPGHVWKPAHGNASDALSRRCQRSNA